MVHEDTINLLKECNAGAKMAVISIDEVLEKVKSESLKRMLEASKKAHEDWGDKTHVLLSEYHDHEEDPSFIAKMMSWLKVNMKLSQNKCDAEVADVITDGCNMGIKSLVKYLNKYKEANQEAKMIANQLVTLEEKLALDLRPFL